MGYKRINNDSIQPHRNYDAQHVATATVHGVDYLLTWNCKHIANAQTLPGVYRLLTNMGYSPPLVATPEEFSEYA